MTSMMRNVLLLFLAFVSLVQYSLSENDCCTEALLGENILCCHNGGICDGTANPPLFCDCALGWGGATCEEELDCCGVSSGEPDLCCWNGGICVVDSAGSPSCSCPSGFSGPACESRCCQNSDFCCANGGTCMTEPITDDNYQDPDEYCECPEGFGGQNCELTKAVCGNNEFECYNGGACEWKGTSGWACNCPYLPLSEDGVIFHLAGSQCDMKATTVCARDGENTITSFCENGGECIDTKVDHQGCICKPGFQGFYCEHEAPLDFGNDGEDKKPTEVEKIVEDDWTAIEKAIISLIVIIFAAILLCVMSYFACNNSRLRKEKGVNDTFVPHENLTNGNNDKELI